VIRIAAKEIELGLVPIVIRRRTPDGRYQDIPLKWLLEASKDVREIIAYLERMRKEVYPM